MPPSVSEPHLVQIILWLSTPIIAVIASIIAGLIAYRQWKTVQGKLKLDLFDRRFKVYDEARNLLNAIITTGVKQDALDKFSGGIREAKWLLNDEIDNYFQNELWKKAIRLWALQQEIDQNQNIIQAQAELKNWFRQQYNVLDKKIYTIFKT
jgi:hypothetical protein